jgi:hypothetical protein
MKGRNLGPGPPSPNGENGGPEGAAAPVVADLDPGASTDANGENGAPAAACAYGRRQQTGSIGQEPQGGLGQNFMTGEENAGKLLG